MSDTDKVILFPRYTSFVGPGTYYSVAMNVREYELIDASFWRGNEIGSMSALNVTLEQSPNLVSWTTLSTFSATADSEDTQSATLTMDWLRIKLEIIYSTGATPALTCWAVANLQRRITLVATRR